MLCHSLQCYHRLFSLCRYESGRGRFAVATQDIPVGDVVCVERPCVSHILPEYLVKGPPVNDVTRFFYIYPVI